MPHRGSTYWKWPRMPRSPAAASRAHFWSLRESPPRPGARLGQIYDPGGLFSTALKLPRGPLCASPSSLGPRQLESCVTHTAYLSIHSIVRDKNLEGSSYQAKDTIRLGSKDPLGLVLQHTCDSHILERSRTSRLRRTDVYLGLV